MEIIYKLDKKRKLFFTPDFLTSKGMFLDTAGTDLSDKLSKEI